MSRPFPPAVLALVLTVGLTAETRADFMFSTPAGIAPGQSFNVVFLDSTGGTAISQNINDYNTAVSSAASGITYSGGTIGSWSIIGSTRTVNEATALFTSPLPVYDLHGALLGSNGNSYFMTALSPSIDQNGTQTNGAATWTGLESFPPFDTDSQFPLGNPNGVTGGDSHEPLAGEGLKSGVTPPSAHFDYYGFATFTAGTATVVPEPATITLMLVGMGGLLGARLARRRRAAASPPSACPTTRS
jgi:hypothetical protein